LSKTDKTNFEMFLEYDIDVEGRRLYLGEEIDDNVCANMIKGFRVLDKTLGPIWLEICCSGGSVANMYAIYDTMRACNNEVYTLGKGHVCSAAGLLLVGGDKRYATENCWFMAHEGTSGADEGSNVTTLTRAHVYAKMDKQWAELMAKHSLKNVKWWVANAIESKKELWWNVDDMLTNGIIDSKWPPKER